MTTWYVRPDTTHNATRNGTSYSTSWGGWSEIVWGGAGVAAGDTLYVCGAHNYAAQISIGAHGAIVNNRVTIRGDYATAPGSIVFSSGSAFLLANRNYTTIKNLSTSAGTLYCLYLYGTAVTGVTIVGCTFTGGVGQACINIAGGAGLSYVDITINDNSFTGGSGSATGSAISHFVQAGDGTPVTTLTRLSVTNNRFTGCSSTRAVIDLWIQSGANVACTMSDIVVNDNTFTNCFAVTMEIIGPDIYGRNTGIQVLRNKIYNQKRLGIFGGGMSINGFAPSTTASFGPNVIANNEAYGLDGPTGMINVFYGTYLVHNNKGQDITTGTIDGTGLLFDHKCKDCVAYGNHFKRLAGVSGIRYSGNVITILDATNIEVYGNIGEDTYCAIHFGDKAAGQSSNIHHNTFINCAMGVDVLSTADMTNNLVRHNIFTALDSSVIPVRVSLNTWTGESDNCFYGFGTASGHTLSAGTKTTFPDLDSTYRPRAAALKRTSVYIGGKDFYGKHFYNPPNFGAVDDESNTPRYKLTS